MVLALDQRAIAASSGSACRAGLPEPSYALTAMGLSEEDAHCAIRFSLGLENSIDDVDRTIFTIQDILQETKESIRFVSCR